MNILEEIYLNETSFSYILDQDYITELERTVLSNDYEKVKLLISRGETIYFANKLCNGYLERKYNYKHTKCFDHICTKTAVYYALFINHNLFRYIYNYILNCNILEKNNIINEIQKYSCGCDYLIKFKYFYSPYHFNFKYHDTILDKYKEYIFIDELNLIDITDINNLKKIITNINNSNESPNIDITLFNCLFHQNNIIINDNNIKTILSLYKTNINIITLLLNQQAYELYKHHLQDKNKIYYHLNEIFSENIIDINYINLHKNDNIFSLSLLHSDNNELIEHLINKNCKIPSNINEILKLCLDKGFSKSVKLLLNIIDTKFFFKPNCLFTEIIQNNIIKLDEKINMLTTIESRENICLTNKLVIEILKKSHSLQFLKILVNNNYLCKHINYEVISYCIKINKYNDLDLLLEYGYSNLDEENNFQENLLNIYLDKTSDDNSDTIKILKIILKYKPKIDLLNNFDESILIRATKKNRKDTVVILLEHGANPFLRDNNSDNCLHIAIKNNYDFLVEKLSKLQNDGIYLVNEPTVDLKSCLTLCLESKDPVKYFNHLISIEGINLEYLDSNNKNILYHIIINKNIDEYIKINLINIILKKNINIKYIIHSDKEILKYCIENNYYFIIELIINKLIEIKEINIDDKNIINAINNNKINNNHLSNIYSPAITYLRQNIFRIKFKKYIKIKDLDNNNLIKEKIILSILFILIFLSIAFIEKMIIKKNGSE